MSDPIGLLNAGYTIDFKGKNLTFRALTDMSRAYITQCFRQKALNDTIELKATLVPNDYRNLLIDTRRDITAGKYDFGGKWFMEAVESLSGLSVFIRAVTDNHRLTDAEVTELLETQGDLVTEYLKLLAPEAKDDTAHPTLSPQATEPKCTTN